MKFRLGQKVKVKKIIYEHDKGRFYLGCVGVLVPPNSWNDYEYVVKFPNNEEIQFQGEELESLEREVPMKDINYGVKYDRDTDPVEFFKSKPQAKKRIQELLDDPEVKKESIYLFQVGTVEKVQRLQNFELAKV